MRWDTFEYKRMLNRILLIVGLFIIVYAILWILAKLNLIPLIIFSLIPQLILLIIGIFIFYQAWIDRKRY